MLLYVIIVAAFGQSLGATWTYDGATGPAQWSVQYPICGMQSQSPIDITEEEAKVDTTLGQFTHSMFSIPPTTMIIKNNGHALQVDLSDGYVIANEAILPNSFKAGQFHYHWGNGAGANGGSEHLLNNNRYFAEMHIVHYNTAYGSVSAAADQAGGLAVLGFFVEASEGTADNVAFNEILAPILTSVTNPNDQLTFGTPFPISNLLPASISRYYKYMGSLTTPPCYETVSWFVFKEPIRISMTQATLLRTNLVDDHGDILVNNFRPVLPLGSRNITTPFIISFGRHLVPNVTFICILGIWGHAFNAF